MDMDGDARATLADLADDCEERFGHLLRQALDGPLTAAELDELNRLVPELIAMHAALHTPDPGLRLALIHRAAPLTRH